MGNGASGSPSVRTLGHGPSSGHRPMGLRGNPLDLELADTTDRLRGQSSDQNRAKARDALIALLEVVNPGCADGSADMLLAKFGSLQRLFSADTATLRRAAPNEVIERLLISTKTIMVEALRADGSPLGDVERSGAAVVRHLWLRMAFLDVECVRVLFLNGSGTILADEEVARGDTRHATLDPRYIIRRSLDLGACCLVAAHNHPSGDPRPSESDRLATMRLRKAAGIFNIEIKDHLILASAGWSSMRALGYLGG